MKPKETIDSTRKIGAIKCSECGRIFNSGRRGITGDDDGFLCSSCYQEFLCPSLKANDMEILDTYTPFYPTA